MKTYNGFAGYGKDSQFTKSLAVGDKVFVVRGSWSNLARSFEDDEREFYGDVYVGKVINKTRSGLVDVEFTTGHLPNGIAWDSKTQVERFKQDGTAYSAKSSWSIEGMFDSIGDPMCTLEEADELYKWQAERNMSKLEAEAHDRNDKRTKQIAQAERRANEREQAWELNKLNVAGIQRIVTVNGPVSILSMERKDGKIETHFFTMSVEVDRYSDGLYDWTREQREKYGDGWDNASDSERDAEAIKAGFSKVVIRSATLMERKNEYNDAWDRDNSAAEGSTEEEAIRNFVYNQWKRW